MYKQDGSSEELEKIGYVKYWHGLRYGTIALPWFRTSLVTTIVTTEDNSHKIIIARKNEIFFSLRPSSLDIAHNQEGMSHLERRT